MKVHHLKDALPVFNKAIITIGTFDGVHTGHQEILLQVKSEAKTVGGESVIITFDPHPRSVVGPQPANIKLLNTLAEKIELLEQEGIHHLVIVPFTKAFASQSARDYIEKFLAEKFDPHTIIIGYDHQFGHNREGDYKLLESVKEEYKFHVKEIPEQVINNSIVSSTKIRKAILEGDIETANEFLGYPYYFEGKVVEGNKLGRTIGYPTANLEMVDSDKLIPGDGVYAVRVMIPDEKLKKNTLYSGMMNIGIRPTVDGSKRIIEVNIFDFDREIYGQNIRVIMHSRLRGEQKFDGLQGLKNQLAKDKDAALKVLENIA